MSFHIGQKVVCVNARFIRSVGLRGQENRVVEGNIYTVRGVFHEHWTSGWGDAILLEEITNEPRRWFSGFHEAGFSPSRFRPITERKTDISIFKKMLTPNKIKERA